MRSLTLGVSPLPALTLLLALLSPLPAHAQGGGFGLGPAQGTYGPGSSPTFADVTADSLILDNGTLTDHPTNAELLFDAGTVVYGTSSGARRIVLERAAGITLAANYELGWSSNATNISGTNVLALTRDAAGSLAVKDPSGSAVSAIALYNAAGSAAAWLTYTSVGLYVGQAKNTSNFALFASALRASSSTTSVVGLGFGGDDNTGVHRSAADTLQLVTGGTAGLTLDASQDATFAGDISKSAAAAFDLSSASSQSITFTPGGSTTRLTLLDSSNAVQCNGNLSSTSGNWNISGFKRATFSYPSGGTEASGNSMHVADNDGATGVATMTLPTPSEGMTFSFYVQDAQEFRVDPAANDKILDVDMTGLADGEYITSSTINSTITIMANGDGDWIVLSKTGTWAEETP